MLSGYLLSIVVNLRYTFSNVTLHTFSYAYYAFIYTYAFYSKSMTLFVWHFSTPCEFSMSLCLCQFFFNLSTSVIWTFTLTKKSDCDKINLVLSTYYCNNILSQNLLFVSLSVCIFEKLAFHIIVVLCFLYLILVARGVPVVRGEIVRGGGGLKKFKIQRGTLRYFSHREPEFRRI